MVVLSLLLFTAAAGCDESLKPAILALQQNNPKQALELLEPLRSSCSQSSNFYEVAGLANELSGNKAAAERGLRTAVALDGRSPRLLTELGATLLQNGEPVEAGRVLDRALLIEPANGVTLKYAAGAALASHNWPRAAELFEQMKIDSEPRLLEQEPILIVWLAQTFIETKQSTRLDPILKRLPNPMPPAVLFSLGTLFAQHGIYGKAVEYLTQISPEAADDALYFNLGLAYSHLQKFDEARRCYLEAIDQHPDHVEAYLHVGLDYVASGHTRMGLPWLYRAHSLAPGRADIASALAEQLISLDYFNTAKEVLAHATAGAPKDPLLLVADGDLKRAQGDLAAAMASYRKALAEKPGLVAAAVALARADLSTNREAEARDLLSTALARDPQDPMVNGQTGLMEAHEGNWPAAKEHLEHAWVADRSNPEIGFELARAYQHVGQVHDALQLLQSIAPEMQDSEAFHFQLAHVYTALHRPAEAQAERDMLTTLQARSQDALHFENPRTYVH
jgi:tetratricopeptide (TPR) repeat protein